MPVNIDPILVSVFAESARDFSWIRPSMQALEKGPVEFFRDEFFRMFDKPEKEPQLFALMNMPGLKSALSILLYAPSWNEKEVLGLEDILPICPTTKHLYGDQTDYTRCAAFVRPFLLKTPVESLKDAKNFNACFYRFLTALSTPLHFNGIKSDFMGQMELSAYQETKSYFKVIQSGKYGSLDEIFTFYDLQEEFREAYPTDEDFWNMPAIPGFGYAPSFEAILEDLMEKKTKSEAL